MSRDLVKENKRQSKDISWDCLIGSAEAEIQSAEKRILTLKKSIQFFRKQASDGKAFPK